MAVRFSRSGTDKITDHKELLNIGNRTHAEIDNYLDEIDSARGKATSLGTRITLVEDQNELQDNRLSTLEKSDLEQATVLSNLSGEVANTVNSFNFIKDGQIEQDQRLETLELLLGSGGEAVDLVEIVDSRTDNKGNTFNTLKERLDFMQSKLEDGVSTSAGGFLFQVTIIKNSVAELTLNTSYAVGQNEIEVFRGGLRQLSGADYIETSTNRIKFPESLYAGEVIVVRRRSRGLGGGFKLESEHVITSTETRKYKLEASMDTPYKKLELFYNGQLMANNNDFKVQDKEVILSFTPVVGSLLVFQYVTEIDSSNKFALEEIQDIVPGKYLYELKTFDYKSNTLEVYVNGLKQAHEVDYLEVNSTFIEFIKELPQHGKITFVKENIKHVKTTLNQLEKKSVKATPTKPTQIELALNQSDSLTRNSIEVLKKEVSRPLGNFQHVNFDSDNPLGFKNTQLLSFKSSLNLKTSDTFTTTQVAKHADGGKVLKVSVSYPDNTTKHDLVFSEKSSYLKTIFYDKGSYKRHYQISRNTRLFNGVSSYGYATTVYSTSSLTIEAWIKCVNTTGLQAIVSNNYLSSGVAMMINNGKLRGIVGNGSRNYTVDSVWNIPQNTWIHVAMTYNTGEKKIHLYVNGEEYGVGVAGNFDYPKAYLHLGARPTNGFSAAAPKGASFFVGEIYDLRLWRGSRSVGEIVESMYYIDDKWSTGKEIEGSTLMYQWEMKDTLSSSTAGRGSVNNTTMYLHDVSLSTATIHSSQFTNITPQYSSESNLTASVFNPSNIANTLMSYRKNTVNDSLTKLSNQFTVYLYAPPNIAGAIDSITVTTHYTPLPMLLEPTIDIDIGDTGTINYFSVGRSTTHTSSKIRYVISFDKGVTWYTYSNAGIREVNFTLGSVRDNGLSDLKVIPLGELNKLRSGSKTVRIGIYVEITKPDENIGLLNVNSFSEGKEYWMSAIKGTHYEYRYYDAYSVFIYLLQNGDYKINYEG